MAKMVVSLLLLWGQSGERGWCYPTILIRCLLFKNYFYRHYMFFSLSFTGTMSTITGTMHYFAGIMAHIRGNMPIFLGFVTTGTLILKLHTQLYTDFLLTSSQMVLLDLVVSKFVWVWRKRTKSHNMLIGGLLLDMVLTGTNSLSLSKRFWLQLNLLIPQEKLVMKIQISCQI